MPDIRAAAPDEFASALKLMQINMAGHFVEHDLPWDDDWNRANYSDKDNYSIFDGNDWVGFLSLELQSDCLFIHTLQLIPGVQGRNVGLWVFQWIQDQASSCNRTQLSCKAFSDSWVVGWYRRLGFCDVHSNGPFLEMSLDMSS